MPVGFGQPLQPDLNAANQFTAPISPMASYGQTFSDATSHFTGWAWNALQGNPSDLSSHFPGAFNDTRMSPEDANAQYGISGPGGLRFNQPVMEQDAAYRNQQKRAEQYSSILQERSNANPLLTMGASFAGSLFDPVGVGLMAATDGIGGFVKAGLGLDAAADAGGVAARSGLIANAASHAGELFRTAAEGAAYNLPFVGLDAVRSADLHDDMSMGQALQDLAVGSIFHTGMHYAGKLFKGSNRPVRDVDNGAAPGGEGSSPSETVMPSPPTNSMPDAVAAMSESARLGGWLKAVDDMADDRPVDVGQYVEREAAPPSLSDLDETSAASQIPGRWLDEDTAITPRGREFPVRYGLAEMDDLTTSHDNDFNQNPAYPAELQPRDRSLVGAMANNLNMERDLNPRLLMSDVNAAGGAPIIAPDGVVESGNGRTIALRRSAAEGRTDAYPRYRAALEAAGYDTTGMQRPMLVRQRTEPMTGSQRGALARDMNADVTERMSAPEQAQADARRISDDDLATVENPLTDRTFQRAFLQKVAPDQINQLVGPDGHLNDVGRDRISAALRARAFGGGNVQEPSGRSLRPEHAEGLTAAAPQWSRMRAMAARGEIPHGLDITANLNSALDVVRAARAEGQALGSFLAERFGQLDAFSGDAVAPETEAFLRILYRDEGFKKPREPGKVAFALNDYARQAMAVTPGPDLFGASADGSTARQILAGLNDRFARGDAGAIDLRAPGKALDRGPEPAPGVALIDLRAPGAERGGADAEGLRRGDERQAGAEGDGPRDDPELAAKFKLESGADSQFWITPDEATAKAHNLAGPRNAIFGWDEPRQLRIERSELQEDARGKGLGRAMYEQAAFAAELSGKSLASDMEVSPAAARVWEAMKRDGFDVVKNPKAKLYGEGDKALWKTLDNSPVYKIDSKVVEPAKPPSAERLIAADPELKALQDATARMAAENRVAEDEPPASQQPDNIVKALHAAASCLIDAAGEVFG